MRPFGPWICTIRCSDLYCNIKMNKMIPLRVANIRKLSSDSDTQTLAKNWRISSGLGVCTNLTCRSCLSLNAFRRHVSDHDSKVVVELRGAEATNTIKMITMMAGNAQWPYFGFSILKQKWARPHQSTRITDPLLIFHGAPTFRSYFKYHNLKFNNSLLKDKINSEKTVAYFSVMNFNWN